MVEPWVSDWSKFIYGHLHHEPFLPEASNWVIPAAGPLSGANGALHGLFLSVIANACSVDSHSLRSKKCDP
jgi:hypothetical protein